MALLWFRENFCHFLLLLFSLPFVLEQNRVRTPWRAQVASKYESRVLQSHYVKLWFQILPCCNRCLAVKKILWMEAKSEEKTSLRSNRIHIDKKILDSWSVHRRDKTARSIILWSRLVRGLKFMDKIASKRCLVDWFGFWIGIGSVVIACCVIQRKRVDYVMAPAVVRQHIWNKLFSYYWNWTLNSQLDKTRSGKALQEFSPRRLKAAAVIIVVIILRIVLVIVTRSHSHFLYALDAACTLQSNRREKEQIYTVCGSICYWKTGCLSVR
jgi:hypothetical protein